MTRLFLLPRGQAADPGGDTTPLPYSSVLPERTSYGSRVTRLTPGASINDAVQAAAAGLPAGQRALILLDPGVYTDRIAGLPRVDILGATGNPADVEVRADGSGEGGRWSPLNGTPGFVGGITWRLLSSSGSGSGQYAFHHTAVGLFIAERCRFISEAPDRNTAIGADVEPGARIFYLGCELVQQASSNSAAATNMHGTTAGAGATTVFLDSTANGYSGYSDLNTGNADHFWWIGGNLPYWVASGANGTVHLDPDTVGGPIGPTYTGTVIRSTDRPPLPVRGVLA